MKLSYLWSTGYSNQYRRIITVPGMWYVPNIFFGTDTAVLDCTQNVILVGSRESKYDPRFFGNRAILKEETTLLLLYED